MMLRLGGHAVTACDLANLHSAVGRGILGYKFFDKRAQTRLRLPGFSFFIFLRHFARSINLYHSAMLGGRLLRELGLKIVFQDRSNLIKSNWFIGGVDDG